MQFEPHMDAYDAAQSLFENGSHDEAVSRLREELSRDDSAGKLWELLGIIEFSRRKIPAALSALEHASLYYAPLSLQAQFVLAECYLERGFHGAASVIYAHLAKADDLRDDYLESLAWGFARVGAYENALAFYGRSVRKRPETQDTLKGIVFCLRKLRRPAQELVPHLAKRYAMDTTDHDARVQLAWALHECERSDGAATLLHETKIPELNCIRCLMLMQSVFEAAADADGELACRLRLEVLAGEKRARQI